MDLYFDKENLFSFISQREEEDYVDCSRLARRQLHIVYGFEKVEIEGWDEYNKLCFLNEIVDGRGWKEEPDSYNTNYLESKDLGTSFVLLLLNDIHAASIPKNNKITGGVGKEIQTIKKLFCGNDYDLHKLYNIQDKSSLPSWEKLKTDGHSLPCSDIILFDRYIFENDFATVKTNLFKLFQTLTESNTSPCNIVIITQGNQATLWRRYLTDLKSLGDNCVTIAYTPPKRKKEEPLKVALPHDRTILTSYRLFRSGDSFCYFDSKGEIITKGKSLDVDSIAKQDTQNFALTFVKEMQEICDKIHNEEFGLLQYIIGDKKSNLIKF